VVDRGEFRLAKRADHSHVPLQRVFCRFGIEFLAVVKFDIRAQVDRYRQPVGRNFIAERKLRHDVQLFVDVKQLVAKRSKDDAADISPRQSWIENVGVLGKSDAQCGLCECNPRARN